MNKIVVFDLDLTLINVDSSSTWCQYMVDHNIASDPNFLNEEKILIERYENGTLDVNDYIKFSMKPLLNIPIVKIEQIMSEFVEQKILSHVYPQALELIEQYKKQGCHLLIISASAAFIVKQIAKHLGIENVIAIEVEQKDGYFTDKIHGIPSFKEGKIIRYKEYIKDHTKFDSLTFYSDSINDLPLLEEADKAYVVNPNEHMLKESKKRGFEIVHWKL